MTYILHFQTKTSAKPVTLEQIKEYFRARAGYTVNDYQALYDNTDTGVFFTFEHQTGKTPEGASNNLALPVFFNISYGKPHIFVLEAEPELAEFIRNFDLLVSDLFMQSPNFGDYNELDFYRGWNAGNETYYKTLFSSSTPPVLHTLPVQLEEKYWRWNYHVSNMQAELGREIFVPKIMFIEHQSVFNTAVVWTDGMPITLPRVEKVILYRRELSPGFHIGKKEDVALANISDIEPLLKDYPKTTEHLEYYTIIYKDPPKEIKHFIQSQKSVNKDDLKFIPFSEIHDRELIEKIHQKG